MNIKRIIHIFIISLFLFASIACIQEITYLPAKRIERTESSNKCIVSFRSDDPRVVVNSSPITKQFIVPKGREFTFRIGLTNEDSRLYSLTAKNNRGENVRVVNLGDSRYRVRCDSENLVLFFIVEDKDAERLSKASPSSSTVYANFKNGSTTETFYFRVRDNFTDKTLAGSDLKYKFTATPMDPERVSFDESTGKLTVKLGYIGRINISATIEEENQASNVVNWTVRAENEKIQVMTFNLKYAHKKNKNDWDSRKRGIIQIIQDYDPDIIVFQEMCKGFQEDYILDNLGEDKSGGLYNKYHHETFFRGGNCSLTDLGIFGTLHRHDDFWNEACAIYYKADRFYKGTNRGEHKLRTCDDVDDFGGSKRVGISILLEDKITGNKFEVWSVHLENTGDGTENLRCAEKITNIRSKSSTKDYPMIIAGDFNAGSTSDCIKHFKDHGLISAPGITDPNYGSIDNILVQKGKFTSTGYDTIGSDYNNGFYHYKGYAISDHRVRMAAIYTLY